MKRRPQISDRRSAPANPTAMSVARGDQAIRLAPGEQVAVFEDAGDFVFAERLHLPARSVRPSSQRLQDGRDPRMTPRGVDVAFLEPPVDRRQTDPDAAGGQGLSGPGRRLRRPWPRCEPDQEVRNVRWRRVQRVLPPGFAVRRETLPARAVRESGVRGQRGAQDLTDRLGRLLPGSCKRQNLFKLGRCRDPRVTCTPRSRDVSVNVRLGHPVAHPRLREDVPGCPRIVAQFPPELLDERT